MHVVFSTDCSPYQDYQAEVVFHSAALVGQRSPITRIASGCDEARVAALRARYARLYPARFGAHFTPDFKRDERTGTEYHFYNKPRGLLHWLEHGAPPAGDDAGGDTDWRARLIAVIDPDFIFLRPLTAELGNRSSVAAASAWRAADSATRRARRARGPAVRAADQVDDAFRRAYICGAGSPCATVARATRRVLPGRPAGHLTATTG